MNQPAPEAAPVVEPVTEVVEAPPVGDLLNTDTPAPEATPAPIEAPVDQPWNANLPQDLREDATLSRFKTLEEQAKAHKELRAKAGSMINVLKDDSTDDEKRDHYSKLGCPKDATGYQLSLPEGIDMPQETINWFSETAHALGLSKTAGEALFTKYLDKEINERNERGNEVARESQKTKEDLQRIWGRDFEANMNVGNNVFSQMFSPNTQAKIQKLGLQNDPDFIKDLVGIGGKVGEDSTSGTHGKGVALSIDSIRAEMTELNGAKDYWDNPVKQNRMTELSEELSALRNQG